MKLGYVFAAGAALAVGTIAPASAGVEFGRPDFSNWLSRPGVVSCDWNYPSYFRACPTPILPPKPAAPAKVKAKG